MCNSEKMYKCGFEHLQINLNDTGPKRPLEALSDAIQFHYKPQVIRVGSGGKSRHRLLSLPRRSRAARRFSRGSVRPMSTEYDGLEPIEPDDALRLYLDHRQTELSKNTIQCHRYRLEYFVQWCDEIGLSNLNELTGRHLQEYRLWRKENGDLVQISLNKQMYTVRAFVKWCGYIEAVPQDLFEKLHIPRVSPEQQRRDDMLESNAAREILDYLSKFHYASLKHALIALLWETGMRLGAVNSLDIADVDIEDQRLTVRHRPDEGTELKNGSSGERPIAVTPGLVDVLADYIETVRTPVTDEYGRESLFSTSHGRRRRSSLRRQTYIATAPCFRNEPCDGCAESKNKKCPDAVSPHAIRRGSITHFLTEDVPVEIVEDRMNVSRKVLKRHYDNRSEEVKLEQRRGYLDNI